MYSVNWFKVFLFGFVRKLSGFYLLLSLLSNNIADLKDFKGQVPITSLEVLL